MVVGTAVGTCEGVRLGSFDGAGIGVADGAGEGAGVGATVGDGVGAIVDDVGEKVGGVRIQHPQVAPQKSVSYVNPPSLTHATIDE